MGSGRGYVGGGRLQSTSGESLVRQILFGTRFFEKEFGVKNEILWFLMYSGIAEPCPKY